MWTHDRESPLDHFHNLSDCIKMIQIKIIFIETLISFRYEID